MENLKILPHALWYVPNGCQSVASGFIYASFTKIVFVPSKNNEEDEVKEIEIKTKILSFSVDPDANWMKSENKYLAVLDSEFVVSVWDFAAGSELAVKGHRGHIEPNDSKMDSKVPPSSICFLHNKQIISTKNCNLIKYCMVSNTFKMFRDFSKRSPITVVRASEFDHNLFVVGTKFGMILIAQVDNLEIKQQVRGHDSEITCLDWISFDSHAVNGKAPKEAPKLPATPQTPKNDDDLFDIYSFDHLEDEFGAYREKITAESDDELDLKDQAASNSNFDFIEACQSLKSEILGDNRTEADMDTYANPDIDKSMDTYELNEHQYGIMKLTESHNQSMESIPSITPPSFSESSLKCALEADGEIQIETPQEIPEKKSSVFLMSGGKENYVSIWDVSNKTYVSLAKKINWINKGKSSLPGAFTQFVWIDSKTFLVTDGNGDLLEFTVSYNEDKKEISVQKTSKLFPTKGVLNICKTADGKELWTSSIYRQICCLDLKTNKEIMKFDTIQTRINFILPNPVDSNILALCGFDKRICLWNVSDTDKHHISLSAFMNKAHSGVMSLSWHPSEENVLAFGSREGRIGYYYTKKVSMAPVMLKSFTNHEIYSISFAKVSKDSKEIIMLLACDTHRFVYYTQKTTSKIEAEYNEVKHLAKASSVAVNGDIVAVGTQAGVVFICDIIDSFKVLRSFKVSNNKYVSQMDWHQQKLVLCSDMNVHEFDLSADYRDPAVEVKSRVAKGHTNRTCGIRYNKSGSLIVSTCFGGQIKVWDRAAEEITCLSTYDSNTQIFSAIFLPTNEDIIAFGGLHCTLNTYNWKNYGNESKPKPNKTEKPTEWGKISEEISLTSRSKTKRKIAVKVENKIVQEVAEELQNVKLENIPKKATTIFYLGQKELNSDPIKLMKRVLSDDHPETYNEKMFSTREEVKKLINDELTNYKYSTTKTVGTTILPMLNDDLKADILNRVGTKTLTEQDLALAPSISYGFWKNCCEAYGAQCINAGEILKAIPYLLACDQIDETINSLCENDYYREAFMVAKLRKDEEDPIFEQILDKWTLYYGNVGFFEAEAALHCCRKKFNLALEALLKRKSQPEENVEVLEVLSAKLKN